MVYCTLFDSNYLDRGLVLIESLSNVDDNKKIYVLCMDDICYKVLYSESMNGVVPISLKEFEDERLVAVKQQRSRGEYCWTCTAALIKYVIEKYDENICTYVDADMKFYSNPNVLLEEMENNKCFVQTVPHRFAPDSKLVSREKEYGINCVQFNTFVKSKEGLSILNNWIESCMNDCSLERGGDQKYTNSWLENKYVNVSKNDGAGIAPWNINRYICNKNDFLTLYDKFNQTENHMIFYHFQDLVFPKPNFARVTPYLDYWKIDEELVDYIYKDYLNDLYKKNIYLKEKYNIECHISRYITEKDGVTKSLKDKIFKWLKMPIKQKIEYLDSKLRHKLRRKKSEFMFGNIS